MKCRRARQLLFDFIDGASNEAVCAEVDRHLGECPECERFAAEMRRCLAFVHRAPVELLDENFNWKVRLAIHRERNALRSRSAASSAWARAWNFRYAMSAGVALGIVLVAGMIALRVTDNGPVVLRAPVSSPVDNASQATDPRGSVATRVLRPGITPWAGSSLEHFVASGAAHSTQGPPAPGAIDESTTDATIDSLISADLERMTPQERSAYIQRRINRMQLHLRGQQEPPARP